MEERLQRMVEMGDPTAVRGWVLALRRRERIADALEVLRLHPPHAAMRDALWDALLDTVRESGSLREPLVQQARAWYPSLFQERPDLAALLISLCSDFGDWCALAEIFSQSPHLQGPLRQLNQCLEQRTLASPSLLNTLGLAAVFAATAWYRSMLRTGVHPHDRTSWLRILSHFANHPATPAIALQFADSLPDRQRASRHFPRSYLNVLGEQAHEAILHRLVLQETPHAPLLWTYLAQRPHPRTIRFFQEQLSHPSKPIRDTAMLALTRASPCPLEPLMASLESASFEERVCAAHILEHTPNPSLLPTLSSALARQPRAALREPLQRARLAVHLQSKADAAELDLQLAGHRTRSWPQSLRLETLPRLHWDTGEAMSWAARDALVALLLREETHTGPALHHLAQRLTPQSRDTLIRRFRSVFERWTLATNAQRRLFFALGALLDEQGLDHLGSGLGELYRQRNHTWSSYGIAILAKRATPAALFWLEHWMLHGTRSLHTSAQAALDTIAWRQDTDIDQLLEHHVPALRFSPHGELTSMYGHDRPVVVRITHPEGPRFHIDGSIRETLPPARPGDRAPALRVRKRLDRVLQRLELVQAAYARRLEIAMRRGRRWSPQVWRRLFLHPTLQRLTRGLVFAAHTPEGLVSFRWSDGFTPASPLVDATSVSIPHPAQLDWEADEVELAEPFPQCSRPGAEPGAELVTSAALVHKMLLSKWMREHGYQRRHGVGFQERFADGGTVVLHITDEDVPGHCSFDRVSIWLSGAEHPVSLAEAPAITQAEALYDVQRLNRFMYNNEAEPGYDGWYD